jgi:heme exporter protein B
MPLLRQLLAVLSKDIRDEFRQRFAIMTIFLFAFVTIMAVSFALGGISPGPKYSAILLWVTILFSDLAGFAHIFTKEEESGSALALRLSSQPGPIFWGKFFFNLLLGLLVTLFLLPLAVIFLNVAIPDLSLFVFFSVVATIAMVSGTTIVAAISAKARGKGALFTILSFPVLLPVLILAISGSEAILLNKSAEVYKNELLTIISYIMLSLTAGHFLFAFVWKED